jgi:putative ABC transport system permease protein
MRQRSLSTWLTLLSVMLGVALATAVLIFSKQGAALFGQKDYGFDVLVGAKGSPTQLVLNTVYHIDRSPGNISYRVYEDLARPRHPFVRFAVPYAVGDTYEGHRIVATLPKLFGADETGQNVDPERAMEYRPTQRYGIAEGRVFHGSKFEAVIGADIPKRTALKLGATFQVAHGQPREGEAPDIHEEKWEVVGVMAPTGTAVDRVIFITLPTFYAIGGHEEALEAQARLRAGDALDAPPAPPRATAPATKPGAHHHDDHDDHGAPAARDLSALHDEPDTVGHGADAHDAHGDAHAADDHHGHHHAHEGKTYNLLDDGTIELKIPKEEWAVSAVLVKSRGGFQASRLIYDITNGPDALAVNPASVMREFFSIFLAPSAAVLTAVAWLVIVVAAVGILVSIYNSVSARLREIAILRALGATRARILTIICLEAGLIGLLGGLLGIVAGHALAGAGSAYLARLMGEGINWLAIGREQWIYLGVVVALSVLAGLVPALKAYRTPVATNLVAG